MRVTRSEIKGKIAWLVFIFGASLLVSPVKDKLSSALGLSTLNQVLLGAGVILAGLYLFDNT